MSVEALENVKEKAEEAAEAMQECQRTRAAPGLVLSYRLRFPKIICLLFCFRCHEHTVFSRMNEVDRCDQGENDHGHDKIDPICPVLSTVSPMVPFRENGKVKAENPRSSFDVSSFSLGGEPELKAFTCKIKKR